MAERAGRIPLLAAVGPGILVAATGVGAGDLATASFTGAHVGVAVLWAVAAGALLKYVLTEGLARWQLATGETFLEGAMARLGRPFRVVFLLYLLAWSFFVGSALVSACGVTVHALCPIFADAATGKFVFGILQSIVGLGLVWVGGYKLFERVMSVCIGVMFVTVVLTAVLIRPDWGAVLAGLTVPRIPDAGGEGLSWTIALMGGVGGTLTILCYGYWIREKGRRGPEALVGCRVDLAVGYGVTALFGMAMVIIGSQIEVEGKGAGLIVALADCLAQPLGPLGKGAFLIGAWGAVFSSLLGVWQSVPYLFADYCGMAWHPDPDGRPPVSTQSLLYRAYLIGLATVPLLGLFVGFQSIQKAYAVVGACFMPFLAAALLYMNGRTGWVGPHCRNRILTTLLLIATLLFFLGAGYLHLRKTFTS